jgi:hypothetical protein
MQKIQWHTQHYFIIKTTGEPNGHDAGMTLRDYLKAMQGMIQDND